MSFNVRALRTILTGRTGRPYPRRVRWDDCSYCLACGCVYVDELTATHKEMHQAHIDMLDEIARLREIVANLGDLIR